MAYTAGSILQNVRVQVGDPDRDFLSDTIGLEWLSQAEQRFCDEILALDEIKDYTLTAKQLRYDLPSNCIIPLGVMWYKNANRKLDPYDPSVWDDLLEGTYDGQGTPTHFTIQRQQLVIGPDSPTANSATSTASGAITAAATTLGLTAASGTFRSRGFVLIGTEVIEYTAISTTTLTGCTRGVHGTVAASVASAATVTEIDMQMRYRRAPTPLTATTQSPEIPAIWHKFLEKYAMYLYFLARGDSSKAEVVYNEFEAMEKSAKEKVGARILAMRRIRDRRSSFRGFW